jgi:hypothetical protein
VCDLGFRCFGFMVFLCNATLQHIPVWFVLLVVYDAGAIGSPKCVY